MDELRLLHDTIARLDRQLRPIANRTIDVNDPAWNVKLAMAPHPLNEAGIRPEAELTLVAAVELYAALDSDKRQEMREVFRHNSAFAWAATLPFDADTAEHTFAHLVHFSIIDQGSDARDAVLWLADLLATVSVPARQLHELRQRAAALSSDIDRYGFGSTKQLLAHGYGGYARSRLRV